MKKKAEKSAEQIGTAEVRKSVVLTDAQLLAIQLRMQGLNATQCAERLNSGDYAEKLGADYQISARAVQNWFNLPHVASAVNACVADKVETVIGVESERTSVFLPIARDRLDKMVPVALDALEEVLVGDGGKTAPARVKAAVEVLRLAGVVETTKALGTQRLTSKQGLTKRSFEELRQVLVGRVLFGEREGYQPEQVNAEAAAEAID